MQYNYYKLLNVSPSATSAEIKKAYRKKAKACHPDIVQAPQAKEVFQVLNKAYSTLMDSRSRRKYDLMLALHQFRAKGSSSRKNKARGARHRRAAFVKQKARTEEPTPFFKFTVYSVGLVFGLSLTLSTLFSLIFNAWPYTSVFIFIPAAISIFQGWNGVKKHRSEALGPVFSGIKKLFRKNRKPH